MRVIGYGRVSRADKSGKGVSLEVQRQACQRYADAHGWDMTWLADEGVSGGVAPEERRRLKAALALLEAGEATALLFTRIDRASRKTEDFARLLNTADGQGWQIVVTEQGIDTTTPAGRAMAHMSVVFAELERDYIRMRTRDALQVKKEQGVRLGRPRSTPLDVVERVVRESAEGKSAYAIARDLNRDGVPTAQGGRAWAQATVRSLLAREGVA